MKEDELIVVFSLTYVQSMDCWRGKCLGGYKFERIDFCNSEMERYLEGFFDFQLSKVKRLWLKVFRKPGEDRLPLKIIGRGKIGSLREQIGSWVSGIGEPVDYFDLWNEKIYVGVEYTEK